MVVPQNQFPLRNRTYYQTALIGGPDPNFLWVFSREKTISQSIVNEYIQYAKTIGYDTNRLQSY
ncbi:lipocalin family protein [Leptospira kemamanensis]|uniref:lipocalin family protein n=1 Tax=Leptospira kemamanensis TaxID=2484942 RepID=UPI001FC967E5